MDNRLLQTLPGYYAHCGQITLLLQVLEEELAHLEAQAQAAAARVIVSTADSAGLDLWEAELGLVRREDLPLSARRALILAVLDRGVPGTPEKITRLFSLLTGGKAVLTEDPAAYAIALQAEAPAGGADLYSCEQLLRRAVPAHLKCVLSETVTVPGAMTAGPAAAGSLKLTLEG